MDLRKVVFVVRVPCGTCDGAGEVLSEDWARYEDWKRENPQRGGAQSFFLQVEGLNSVPPMNRPCGMCDGTGREEAEFPAEDVVAAVLRRVPAAVIPRGELDEVADSLRETLTQAAMASKGLADLEGQSDHLRVVQEAAAALTAVTDLLVRGDER